MSDLDLFLDDAITDGWRPEPDTDGDGLRRRLDTIWLTNDGGDSLQVDEDTAAMLVNSAFHMRRRIGELLTALSDALAPDGTHRLVTGYCLDCGGGCLRGFGVSPVPYVEPSPIEVER